MYLNSKLYNEYGASTKLTQNHITIMNELWNIYKGRVYSIKTPH